MPKKLKNEDVIKVDGGLIVMRRGWHIYKYLVKDNNKKIKGKFRNLQDALAFSKENDLGDLLQYEPKPK